MFELSTLLIRGGGS
ncbi:hypothetical protein [African swine fever virus]